MLLLLIAHISLFIQTNSSIEQLICHATINMLCNNKTIFSSITHIPQNKYYSMTSTIASCSKHRTVLEPKMDMNSSNFTFIKSSQHHNDCQYKYDSHIGSSNIFISVSSKYGTDNYGSEIHCNHQILSILTSNHAIKLQQLLQHVELLMQAFYIIWTLYAINIILRSYFKTTLFHTPTTNTLMRLMSSIFLFRMGGATPSLIFTNSSDPNAPSYIGWISAYYSGSIWLFKTTSIIEYNINNEIYYDRSSLSTINFGTASNSHSWAQVGNILYAIPGNNGVLGAFNLATKQIDSTFSSSGGCYRSVCTYGNKLLALQGSNCGTCCSDEIRMYKINQQTWTTINTRSTDGPRKSMSCQVVNNVLYVIGGQDNTNKIYDTVMTINVQGIGLWSTSTIYNYNALNNKLSHPRRYVRTWVYNNLIYVISWGSTDVDVIDTSTGSIGLDSHLLHSATQP
eukprot:46273_1